MEPLAPVVITAFPEENKVLVDFAVEIPSEIENLFNNLDKDRRGLRIVRLTKESRCLSDYAIYHSLAWESDSLARLIRSLLADKGFDEIYAQIRNSKVNYTQIPWNT